MNHIAATTADHATATMKAVRISAFGGIERIEYADVPRPTPGPGQVLVRVAAAGVGPWDTWVREGKSVLPQPLPLVLGSDISGTVAALARDVAGLRPGDAVFGVTNAGFTGGYAEYALAEAAMIAHKPSQLNHPQAASMPVVATTARQMLFDHARIAAGQRVLVLGGAGNVGGYAVQLAHAAGAEVIATAFLHQAERVLALGATSVLDPAVPWPKDLIGKIDAVIDTVGGAALTRAFDVVRTGGNVISAVAEPDLARAAGNGVHAAFILVSVTTADLELLAALVETGKLRVHVGEVLPLAEARRAHEMLAGRPHRPGKIVLVPAADTRQR
jgi:NADPH:quinone reductase-like Zn-dependent oxidoreductase